MGPADFSALRALHWLQRLSHAASPRRTGPPPLAAALAASLAEVLQGSEVQLFAEPLPVDPAGALGADTRVLGARLRGRKPGPPWLLCAPVYLASGTASWRPNAHGSGAAVLLALLEALISTTVPQDILCAFLPAGAEPTDQPGAEAWATKDLLALRGVIAVWQVAGPGMALDPDLRSLVHPQARPLAHELFRLGVALGYTAFARGAQTAYPGPHVPFQERGLPAVPLCANSDPFAGSEDDRLDACAASSLKAVGDTLLRFLRGERLV